MATRSVFRSVLWIVVALLLVVHVVGGWGLSGRIIDESFTPDPDPVVVPDGNYELEEVTYTSDLGTFDAWYLPAAGTTWVIHVHGINATPAEPQVLFAPLQEAGYRQLSITYRNDEGQPEDPSGYFQYGATEWQDVLGAVEYARANGARDIVFAGYGAGASHALAYAYRHNFDDIAGIITDSGNMDMGATVDYQASQDDLAIIPLPVPPTIAWTAEFFTSLRINVNWKSLDYIEKAKRSLRIPVLAIHGTADRSIPISESIDLEETQPELVELWEVEGAGHLDAFNSDHDEYVARVLAFLEDVG